MTPVAADAGTGAGIEQARRIATPIPGPRSVELAARRAAAVPAAVSTALPVFIERAEGAILRDVDGNQLIDLGAGIAVVSIGHAAPRLVAAVSEQVARFTHTCFMVTPYEGYVRVCEELARLTPGTHEKRSVLLNSGAEAVENAVKIARYATGRSKVVVFEHAYHGRTLLTMSLTAKDMPYRHGFGPFAPAVERMPMAYPFRWPGGAAACARQALAAAVSAIDNDLGADQVAAVVIEPIQGEGGFIVPPAGFLPGLAAACRERGILFVADEVQTGFARTGAMFACEHEGIVPDLMVTAKGIAGGMPLGAVTGRAELMDAVHVGGLGGTYGGNPVSCAAALAAIETIEAEGLVARARHLEALMRPRLNTLAEQHAVIGEVRGRGAMLAVELVGPEDTPDPAAAQAVAKFCHVNGVVVLTCGTYGNVLRFLPPLVIGDALLTEALGVLEAAFAAL